MKAKLIALILAVALALTLISACGGNPDSIDPNGDMNTPGVGDPDTQQTPTSDDTPDATPTTIGDRERDYEVIEFGDYVWRVLDMQDGRTLVISEDVLEHRSYHDTLEDITWEASDIRSYLNGDFYNSFGEADRARIADTNVINSDNPWTFSYWQNHPNNTPGGADTTDKIFLLSIDEVIRYFGDSGMLAMGNDENVHDENLEWPNQGIYYWGIHDEHSENRIAYDVGGTYIDFWGEEYTREEGEASWWWLRSPGFIPELAAYVGHDGDVAVMGNDIRSSGGVRPALWLILE